MQLFHPMMAITPALLTGLISTLLAVVVSFAIIVLVSSYFRFISIIKRAEEEGVDQETVTSTDVLRVQLARYLAGCKRRGSSFSLALIRTDTSAFEAGLEAPAFNVLKKGIRHDDIVCVFDEQTFALIAESEPEDGEIILSRVRDVLDRTCPDVDGASLRVGMSSYPVHGLNGTDLIALSLETLKERSEEQPMAMAEIREEEEEELELEGEEAAEGLQETPEEPLEAEEEDEISQKEEGGGRKQAMLDDLTGVLKPSAVSAYMQRMMNDIRQKRKKASLFCIGVNNVEHMLKIHGEAVVDDVLAGVSKVLQENVRASDLIGRHEKYAFLILAQLSLEHAELVGRRISTMVQQSYMVSGTKKLKTSIAVGVASHPEHGRNLHLLYVAGQKVLDYNRANDIRSFAVYNPEIHDSMPSKPMRNIKSLRG